MVVRIIKDWDIPDILRQTPGNRGNWGQFEFTTQEVENCDYVVVFNRITEDIKVNCPPSNIAAVMQEPYIKGIMPWMEKGHDFYSTVFTHHIFNKSAKYIPHHPMLPWHVNKSFDELINMKVPDKNKMISWISSTKGYFPGHRERMKYLDKIKESNLRVDLFGRGIREIGDKWDGLRDYRYSIAIENSSSENYWTEKLADCFLAFSMPIYYGCVNIKDYFPEGSFIEIDIQKPEESFEIIDNAIRENLWEKNIDAIIAARELVLKKYQFFPSITSQIEKMGKVDGVSENLILKPYVPGYLEKITNYLAFKLA